MDITRLTSCHLRDGRFVLPLVLWLLLGQVFTLHAAEALGEESYFPFPDTDSSMESGREEWLGLKERLDEIEKALQGGEGESVPKLQARQQETTALKESVSVYVETLKSRHQQLKSTLETLGEPVAAEAEAIAEQRQQVIEQRDHIAGLLVGYRLLLMQADELHQKLDERRQHLLTERLLARGTDSITLLSGDRELLKGWFSQSHHYLSTGSGLELLTQKQLFNLVVLLLIAVVLGVLLRRKCMAWCSISYDKRYRYAQMVLAALGHYAPYFLVALVMALNAQLVLSSAPHSLAYLLGLSLPLFLAGWALLHFLFRGSDGSDALFALPGAIGRRLGRNLKLLLLLGYLASLMRGAGLLAQMSEAAKQISQDLFVVLTVLALLGVGRNLNRLMLERGVRGVYGLLLLLLGSAMVAELSGYRNMAYWLLRLILGTGVIVFMAWLSGHLLKEFFEGFRSGRFWWQKGLRRVLGYGVDEAMPWLGWIYALAVIVLWLLAAYGVMKVWGISGKTMESLLGYLLDGFQVGSLTIVPLRVVIAILIFAILLALSGWVRRRMESVWLVNSRMERGSREALVTISGYTGMAVALLIALAVAGVKFTSLAIIAGALSVGIGFGLQNIVNNFVSGLILLFERPVKTGDWIMVGSTEGYVKRISIRSTLIQTFDRADVIVPNSELISSQVTNWMLYDPRGRVRVPVGVAYGSDTQKIKELLLQIAAAHPSVITDGSMTEPKVLFLGFGDSSLNFELRAFIQNIDERLQVVSDINFAIDAAFREHNIEIPFPQRDLHVRSWQSPPDSP